MTIIKTDKDLPPRAPLDFYPTPLGFCRSAVQWLHRSPATLEVLDPGFGAGPWGRAAVERWKYARVSGVELRDVPMPPGYQRTLTKSNYLTTDLIAPWGPFDVVLGNPPYSHAEAFVRRSLALLRPGGDLLFLLRLAFLQGQGRAAGLFAEFPPVKVGVVSKRISFTGDGKTDDNAYALYHWRESYIGATQLDWMSFNYDPEDRKQKAPPVGGNSDSI